MGRLWYSRLAATLAASQFLVSCVFAQEVPSVSSIALESLPIPSESPISTESTSPTSTPSREPQVHIVKTGAGGFKLDPQEIHNVSVGDIVSFEFYPTGHSIARAEYASACSPYEYTGKGKVGFWSGEISVEDVDHLKYFNITVNSTEPIFYYCGAETSCMKHHMVGAINPNSTQTLASQIHAAAMADYELLPGEPIPKEGATSSLSSSSPTSTSTASSTPPPPSSSQGEDKLSTGAIVGISIGVAAFVIICATLFFFVGRHGKLKDMINRHNNNNNNNAPQNSNMAQHPYGDGGLASPQFTQQRYGTPPPGAHADYGFNSPPQYGIGEPYAGAWANPQQQQHSHMHTMSQEQIEQFKFGQTSMQPAELHSPPLGQEAFRQELEAASPRNERK